ncbi:hypothetical protein Tco_0948670 [Tanacetum coccineum]
MDNLNITMKEYIRLEEEKARQHGKVYNWETTKYGKIWYDEDVHELRSVETEFPAIVFNDELSPEKNTLLLHDFENEFPAIVYNDALTSKSDFLTEPTLSPEHIDEFDLKDETSLFEYDEVDQNILYLNDLFPFNIIYPDNLKSDKDNDDNEIDIIQSMLLNLIKNLYVPFGIQFDPKRYSKDGVYKRILRRPRSPYGVEGYTEEIVHDFEDRLETIFGRQEIFVSHAWRRLFEIQASLVCEFILEFFSTCKIGNEIGLDVADTLCFQLGGARRSMTWGQFILTLGLHTAEEMAEDGFEAPEKVTATDLLYLRSMDRGKANVPYLLAQYLFRHTKGRKSGARLSGGHFIRRLAHHFGLVSDDGLRGLSVVTRELPLIDMGELVKLNICMEVGDDWAWVAQGVKRQPVVAAATLGGAEDASDVDEGA